MTIEDLLHKDVHYSFDRVRFLSFCTVDELRAILPAGLEQHCNSNDIVKQPDKLAKKWGHRSKIDAVACSDYFMDTLCDFQQLVLSHVEIAQDIIFESEEDAIAYSAWFEENVRRKHTLKKFKFKTTLYLGKESGDDDATNYVRAYVRSSKITGEICFHSEFVIEGADRIKKVLHAQRRMPSTSSMDLYHMLDNEYLSYSGYRERKGIKFGSMFVPNADYKRIKARMNEIKRSPIVPADQK